MLLSFFGLGTARARPVHVFSKERNRGSMRPISALTLKASETNPRFKVNLGIIPRLFAWRRHNSCGNSTCHASMNNKTFAPWYQQQLCHKLVGTNTRTRDPHRGNFSCIEVQNSEHIGWQWPATTTGSTWVQPGVPVMMEPLQRFCGH